MLKRLPKNTPPPEVPNLFSNPLDSIGLWIKISIIAVVAIYTRAQPTHPTWAVIMILWAALILVPIGLEETRKRQEVQIFSEYAVVFEFLFAVMLGVSFCLDKDNSSGIWASGYVLFCANYALSQFFQFIKTLLKKGKRNWNDILLALSFFISWGFLANASLWLVFDRLGYTPLNFSPWIVLLTGAHFHYAGFALMMSLTLLLADKPTGTRTKFAIAAVIIGVVCTAFGIMATQLGWNPFLETFAGVIISSAGFFSGLVFFSESFLQKQKAVAWLWRIGGLCLMCGMILAGLYALRTVFSVPFLNLGFMQAVHGTLNALGFGTLMLIGWCLKEK